MHRLLVENISPLKGALTSPATLDARFSFNVNPEMAPSTSMYFRSRGRISMNVTGLEVDCQGLE